MPQKRHSAIRSLELERVLVENRLGRISLGELKDATERVCGMLDVVVCDGGNVSQAVEEVSREPLGRRHRSNLVTVPAEVGELHAVRVRRRANDCLGRGVLASVVTGCGGEHNIVSGDLQNSE